MIKVSVKGVDKALKRVREVRDRTESKLDILLRRLTDIGANVAQIYFDNAQYAGTNDVVVTVERVSATEYKVVATGKAVLFIEFGTGTTYPEHPDGAALGYVHGTYGKGQGNAATHPNGWYYYGEQGTSGIPVMRKGQIKEGVYRTLGNPPARAMYTASKNMKTQLASIAREVFGGD